jgi:outer membrane biosynthesis protein TonB
MPRYRTRGGVEFEGSASAAAFLGAEPVEGGAAPAEPHAVREPIEPPHEGPAEPVQQPPGGPDAADPVQQPAPPATGAEEVPDPQQQPEEATEDQPQPEPAAEQGDAGVAAEEAPVGDAGAGEAAAAPEQPAEDDSDGGPYSGWTINTIKAEIRRRNEGRDDADRLPLTGDKAELVEVLRADDVR